LKLLRLNIIVNSKTLGEVKLELDIRELKIIDGHIKETLELDSQSRDFRVNAMQFEVRLHKLYDPEHGPQKKCGLTDIANMTLTPVRDPHSVFEDRRRIIRAIRLSAQHGLKYSDQLFKCLSQDAAAIFQQHNHHPQLVPEYDKCLRDLVHCSSIFEQLAKWHLIHAFNRTIVSSDLIAEGLLIMHDHSLAKKDNRLEQLMTHFESLGAAIVVSLALLKSAFPSQTLGSFIQSDNKLQQILSTLMVCPESHIANESVF
jgi:hypothetical protein